MEHPLLSLVPPTQLPEPEQDELWRSVAALQSSGWTRDEVDQALRIAFTLAGDLLVRYQQPLVICDDEDSSPFVAIRLPVFCPAKTATELSRQLRARLQTRGLDRPGMSINFWSITPRERARPRGQ